MKIVLDTNCLLVMLPQQSPYRCLWDAFRREQFSLCYTTDITIINKQTQRVTKNCNL